MEILRRGGLGLENSMFLIQHVDADQGMEWHKNHILCEQKVSKVKHLGIFERMADVLPDYPDLNKLNQYLKKGVFKKRGYFN